ncbi:MAG TPA: radical SAM family heme chaperone HemW [Burkholderiales bacterium]|nr:radical SAM family heme chaperone HemW [Burkholderiales bacterium]
MSTVPVLPYGARPGPQLAVLPPLGLYVHVPWCVRKCPYCDFNSHELRPPTRPEALPAEPGGQFNARPVAAHGRPLHAARKEVAELDPALELRYIRALTADLEHALPSIRGRTLHSIFLGGGTPSLLSVRAVEQLLSAIRARLRVDSEAEVTLEANPGTVEAAKFAGFRAAGVNRLSLGIQSFDRRHLATLGRIHDEQQARRAIEIALRHFDNINLDLMYALPGQSLDEALADARAALASRPAHLSFYHLTIEPNTCFHRYRPQLPDEDVAADMQEAIEQLAAEYGYRHYETSAFARPGREARHNLNYWTFGDYVGIGAGAHGKISSADRIVRETRWKHPREYMERVLAGQPLQSSEEVSVQALPFEFMMNALRLIDGVPTRLFVERTGLPLTEVLPALEEAQRRGLIESDALRLRPTARGQRFLNELLQLFLR